MSGTGKELWARLMVWASRQVSGANVGVPVTPLPKGLPEVRDWPLEVLRGVFEASTLPVTMVEAVVELPGDITPSWALAPVVALLHGESGQRGPPHSNVLDAYLLLGGGRGVTEDHSSSVGGDVPPVGRRRRGGRRPHATLRQPGRGGPRGN